MKKYFLLALSALLLVACAPKETQVPPVAVKTTIATAVSVKQEIPLGATLEGRQDVYILPQVSGFLTEVCVLEGQAVEQGQRLFELDRVQMEAEVRSAEAEVEVAKAAIATADIDYKSEKRLYERNVVSEFEVTKAENTLHQAEAYLARAQASVINAKKNLSYCTVTAPCAGVVGRIPFKVGALVGPQMDTPLTILSDNSYIQASFAMGEKEMIFLQNHIKKAQQMFGKKDSTLQVYLCMINGEVYKYPGHIISLSGVIDKNTGTARVKAEFPNPDRLLHSGGSCQVLIPNNYADVIVIPQEATYELQGQVFAYKVVNGRAKAVDLDVETVEGNTQYIVKKGLEVGDTIVAEGANKIIDGQIIPPYKAAPSADQEINADSLATKQFN